MKKKGEKKTVLALGHFGRRDIGFGISLFASIPFSGETVQAVVRKVCKDNRISSFRLAAIDASKQTCIEPDLQMGTRLEDYAQKNNLGKKEIIILPFACFIGELWMEEISREELRALREILHAPCGDLNGKPEFWEEPRFACRNGDPFGRFTEKERLFDPQGRQINGPLLPVWDGEKQQFVEALEK